ncbi:protein AMBP-like [Centropristis striata]|uniref:protein AMBP-like n=1 Tax=Centropristis striata TaxID=184440 RepID=UPI0027DF9C94|nr:protein AMBP-like [Centropristis striata]
MHKAVTLVSVLVLGWSWTLQGDNVLPTPLYPTQENFNLSRMMGKWYELAVVSTSPHYMERKRENPVIAATELQHVASENNFTKTDSILRNGTCTQMSKVIGLTNTPGRFFHHETRLSADVDSFLVDSNYDEYAMMLQLSTEKPSGNLTTVVTLYSRTMDVRPAVLDDFKTLVKHHGMSDDAIIIQKNKDDCVSGEQVTKPITT